MTEKIFPKDSLKRISVRVGYETAQKAVLEDTVERFRDLITATDRVMEMDAGAVTEGDYQAIGVCEAETLESLLQLEEYMGREAAFEHLSSIYRKPADGAESYAPLAVNVEGVIQALERGMDCRRQQA